jgi:CBS domain-containing protein
VHGETVHDADGNDRGAADDNERTGRVVRKTRLQCVSGYGDGKVLGIVTKFDFLRAFAFTSSQAVPHYDELMRRPVEDMMTEAIVHVDPASPLTRVLQLMVSLKVRSFPVMTPDGQLEGMISREDVMRGLRETTPKLDRSDGASEAR